MGSPLTQTKITILEQQQQQGATASKRLNLQTEVPIIDFTMAFSERTMIFSFLFQLTFL
jgi:hypothetical protein